MRSWRRHRVRRVSPGDSLGRARRNRLRFSGHAGDVGAVVGVGGFAADLFEVGSVQQIGVVRAHQGVSDAASPCPQRSAGAVGATMSIRGAHHQSMDAWRSTSAAVGRVTDDRIVLNPGGHWFSLLRRRRPGPTGRTAGHGLSVGGRSWWRAIAANITGAEDFDAGAVRAVRPAVISSPDSACLRRNRRQFLGPRRGRITRSGVVHVADADLFPPRRRFLPRRLRGTQPGDVPHTTGQEGP